VNGGPVSAAGITALAVAVPNRVRTNADIVAAVPLVVGAAESGALARAFAPTAHADGPTEEVLVFERCMAPYVHDPFRGSRRRRVLAPGQTSVDLEAAACRSAMAAAGLNAGDVDLLICSSAPPERLWPGNAADVAARLGVGGNAFNVESWNAGLLVAVDVATRMVGAGSYASAVVAGSASYSRLADLDDTFSWFVGDAAAAIVVEADAEGGAHLVVSSIRANPDAGHVFDLTAESDAGDGVRLRIRPTEGVRTLLVPSTLRELARGGRAVLEAAGVTAAGVDVLVGYSSTAWMASTCGALLRVPTERVVDVHPRYGNVGPVIPLLGLHQAATDGRLQPGMRALVQATGPDSCTASLLLTWGDVLLPPLVEVTPGSPVWDP
jgi:3-oxoacyl-[acyl-carrier-protein] synthase III